MRVRHAGRNESRADANGVGSHGHCSPHCLGVADTTGGHDRNVDGRPNSGQQLGKRDMPAHVAAGLHALGDHVLAAGIDRGLGLIDRPDLPAAHDSVGDASSVGPLVEELDDRKP